MHIVTPTEIEQVTWEGALEPLGKTVETFDTLTATPPRPRVTLGEPVWWPAEEAMESETGKTWSHPDSISTADRRYTLLRLACTLHPPDDRRAC